nr:chromosome segregation protein ScpA [Desulfobacterales bacterium]
MVDNEYCVRLEIFEGPMDLLFHLVRENRLDICEIPISLITKEYLEHLDLMKTINIDLASDFLIVAATLIRIKSRTLLPVSEEGEEDEEEGTEIARPLSEYLRFKKAAETLATRPLLDQDVFVRRFSPEDWTDKGHGPMVQVGICDLIDVFKEIMENAKPEYLVDLTREGLSVKKRIAELVDILEKSSSITFQELFSSKTNRSEIVITFLAILEMVKMDMIRIAQQLQDGVVRIFYG